MHDKAYVLDSMKRQGQAMAQNLQQRASDMAGTELNAESAYLPAFRAACGKKNMLDREAGFVCISSAGRVVRLLQPYNSDVFTGEPEELEAQWGFVWSKDPAHARPFVALSTSPYMKGDVCSENGAVYRSLIDKNVWAPSAYPQGWEVAA